VLTLREIRAVRRTVAGWRKAAADVALVPTMGNLHEGHIALVRRAKALAGRVVVSVFVNPTQFGPGEDFAAYPRTLPADAAKLRTVGADLLFLPTVRGMYPRGEAASTVVSVPALSRDLCGEFRPGHFDGVASVVLRLLNVVAPDVAVFGEKDYQQLVLLRRMAADLHVPVRLVGVPTVRERDGLAMSSRNQYLDADERSRAPALHAALLDCRAQLLAGARNHAALERAAVRALRRAGFVPDYVAIRSAADLAPPSSGTRDLRILAAARLGRARLIDNLGVRLR
jgi:pantoate--beta-alanine ligase